MLKAAGALVLLGACTLEGFRKSAALSLRAKFWEEFTMFLSVLKARMKFSLEDIRRLMLHCEQFESLAPLYECFKGDEAAAPSELFEKGASICASKSFLSRDDAELLKEFSSQLGATDLDGQLEHIGLFFELSQKRLEQAKSELKQKSKLYRLLGFFAGSAIALIIT